jgi:uncharacterized protein VirK/YbjX
MKTNELLAKYPLATEVIRKSYFDKMIASVESAKDIPEEFKQSLMNEAITDERLVIFIDSQPRTLFDVFDDNELYINIERTENKEIGWVWGIASITYEISVVKTRKEAELSAIAEAFKLLEEKITPIEFPNIEDEAVNND